MAVHGLVARGPNEILGPSKISRALPSGEYLSTSSEHDGWQVYMEFTADRGKLGNVSLPSMMDIK